jgi:N-formylglutamate amidohydrolase
MKRSLETPPVAPVVLHIPHASHYIPPAVREEILLDDGELESELLRMTDAYTDELFTLQVKEARTVTYPVSRLVVDPERFLDDEQEVMAQKGMGVIYTRTSNGNTLRGMLTEKRRAQLLASYYYPHHQRLSEAVSRTLEFHGQALVIDCHSFPSIPLPYELYQSHARPEICIGTDRYHSPPELIQTAVKGFEKAGYSVEIDRPFSGALVPLDFHQTTKAVRALMIEVNRSLYMDEKTGERLERFSENAARVSGVLRTILTQLT